FFLMTLQPPTFTLFPYTTLFRSRLDPRSHLYRHARNGGHVRGDVDWRGRLQLGEGASRSLARRPACEGPACFGRAVSPRLQRYSQGQKLKGSKRAHHVRFAPRKRASLRCVASSVWC